MTSVKEFHCPMCGKMEMVPKMGFRKLCTECGKEKRLLKGREHDRKRRPQKLLNITCRECGLDFEHQGIGVRPMYCLECRKNYSKVYEQRRRVRVPIDPEVRAKYLRKYRFGVTSEEFETRLDAQGGKCEVCLELPKVGNILYLDHDHRCCPGDKTCGKCLRGFICQRCNSALGQAMDDERILRKMKKYLSTGGAVGSPNSQRLRNL